MGVTRLDRCQHLRERKVSGTCQEPIQRKSAAPTESNSKSSPAPATEIRRHLATSTSRCAAEPRAPTWPALRSHRFLLFNLPRFLSASSARSAAPCLPPPMFLFAYFVSLVFSCPICVCGYLISRASRDSRAPKKFPEFFPFSPRIPARFSAQIAMSI